MNTNPRIENIGEAVSLAADVSSADDIIELMCRLDVQYRQDAVFLLNKAAYRVARKLQYANGEYLWRWKGDHCTLLDDYQVISREDLPAVAMGEHIVIFASRAYAAQQGWAE